jgi:Tfp pilus assembly protein PilO
MTWAAAKLRKPWQVDAAGAVILLALAACAYLTVAVPAQRQRQEAARIAAEMSAKEDRRRELESAVRRAADEINQIKQLTSRGSLQLEPESKLNQRIAALNELAAHAGFALDGIEPGIKRAGSLFHVTPIRLTGKGRYAQVTAFVSSLHRRMPDTPVTSMELSAVPSTTTPTVTFTVELQWHTAVVPAAAPAPAPPNSTKPTGGQLTNGI